jgi:Rap1a immunity proteins
MKFQIAVAITALAYLFPQCATADNTNGAKLLTNCKIALSLTDGGKWTHPDNKIEDATAYGHCFGFIEAAWQATPAPEEKDAPFRFCFPDHLTVLQLTRAYVKYADSHQDRIAGAALYALYEAFDEVYPCKK